MSYVLTDLRATLPQVEKDEVSGEPGSTWVSKVRQVPEASIGFEYG